MRINRLKALWIIRKSIWRNWWRGYRDSDLVSMLVKADRADSTGCLQLNKEEMNAFKSEAYGRLRDHMDLNNQGKIVMLSPSDYIIFVEIREQLAEDRKNQGLNLAKKFMAPSMQKYGLFKDGLETDFPITKEEQDRRRLTFELDLADSNFDVKCEEHKQMVEEWTPQKIDDFCKEHGFSK